MALRTPPSWLQNGSHPAENDRLTTQAIWKTTGIINSTDLAVTQNSPAGMSVLVASGWAAIVGTTQTNMGVYMAYNDASSVATITTANPSNPRIDLICITVSDAYYTGSLNQVAFNVVAGTPAGSPTVPSTPANSIALAQIAVGAGVTSIVTANITDVRVAATSPFGSVTLTGTQTLTNKTLTAPVIATIVNSGTLTLPTSTDTLVGRDTTDTLTNKTLTAPIINTGYSAKTASYTTVLGDNGYLLSMNNASATTFSIPTNASVAYPVGAQISFAWITGAGQPTIQAVTSGTTTILSTGATSTAPKLRVVNSVATAVKIATDIWLVTGDLA
jgi:hypothetical protein